MSILLCFLKNRFCINRKNIFYNNTSVTFIKLFFQVMMMQFIFTGIVFAGEIICIDKNTVITAGLDCKKCGYLSTLNTPPVQCGRCGAMFCLECIASEEKKVCSQCQCVFVREENATEQTAAYLSDTAWRRQVENIKMFCSSSGCAWSCNFGAYRESAAVWKTHKNYCRFIPNDAARSIKKSKEMQFSGSSEDQSPSQCKLPECGELELLGKAEVSSKDMSDLVWLFANGRENSSGGAHSKFRIAGSGEEITFEGVLVPDEINGENFNSKH